MDIPSGVASIADPLSGNTINQLTNLAIEPLEMLISLWNGGIGKAVLIVMLVMFSVALIVDFFKFAQEKAKEAFKGWGW